MSYDYNNAIKCGAQIITMQLSQIKKLKMFFSKKKFTLNDLTSDKTNRILKLRKLLKLKKLNKNLEFI